MSSSIEVEAQQYLRDAPTTSVSFKLPVVISAKLDEMVAQANASGERTDRRELLAALILDLAPNEAAIREALRAYRTARNQDASIDPSRETAPTMTIRAPRPGPRARNG